jgi:hypothetical protein
MITKRLSDLPTGEAYTMRSSAHSRSSYGYRLLQGVSQVRLTAQGMFERAIKEQTVDEISIAHSC